MVRLQHVDDDATGLNGVYVCTCVYMNDDNTQHKNKDAQRLRLHKDKHYALRDCMCVGGWTQAFNKTNSMTNSCVVLLTGLGSEQAVWNFT